MPTGLTPRITTPEPVAACLLLSGFFFARDGRDPVVPLGQLGGALGPADGSDDIGRVDAAVDQPAQNCLVH